MQVMNTDVTLRMRSTGSDETERLGEQIGRHLKGGEVIELVSDLGGGKTIFVKGLAVGMGSDDQVASPTFTISREYRAGKLTLHHFDFYRLNEPGIIKHELAEILGDPKTVVVIEWAEIVQQVLPRLHITVGIKTIAEQEREITIHCPTRLKYVIQDIQT